MVSDTDPLSSIPYAGDQRRTEDRFSVSDRDDCIVYIGPKAYLINNLSLSGIGLLLPLSDSFSIGEVIGDRLKCRINIVGNAIDDLEYRIVYMSPAQGDNMICGLKWVNPDEALKSIFESALAQLN